MVQKPFPSLRPPSDAAVQELLDAIQANPNDIGVGIVDTLSGQIYVSPASLTPDHPSLVEAALGIIDFQQASHLRGFVVGAVNGAWVFANNSSLNAPGNRMNAILFQAVVVTLEPKLR